MHTVISKRPLTVSKNIPVAGPSITEKEIAYVTDAIVNNWYSKANEYIERFERSFAAYVGRRYAISVPSCTSALHLSLLALGIGSGDEVIVPDITWIATAAPIFYAGASPVFADIDSNTWCLSENTIRPKLTKKTKAIIVVNLYGNMAHWDPILKLSEEHNIPVIEDAAESVGSKYKNRLSGSFGIASCFSFHGSKTLTTGEGGMFLTDREDIYQKCLILRDHGRLPGDIMFRNIQIGYKYKMSALQAALGLAQLERIDELIQKKREIFSWYQEAFSREPAIALNPELPYVFNSYWMSTILFRHTISKGSLIDRLKEQNIQARPFFDPLSSLKACSSCCSHREYMKENPCSYEISAKGVNLPSALCLKKEDVDYVKDAILSQLYCTHPKSVNLPASDSH